jgi:hypothetical protein
MSYQHLHPSAPSTAINVDGRSLTFTVPYSLTSFCVSTLKICCCCFGGTSSKICISYIKLRASGHLQSEGMPVSTHEHTDMIYWSMHRLENIAREQLFKSFHIVVFWVHTPRIRSVGHELIGRTDTWVSVIVPVDRSSIFLRNICIHLQESAV